MRHFLTSNVYDDIFDKNDNNLTHLYDKPQDFLQNQAAVLARLSGRRLLLLDQQHSDIAHYVDDNYSTSIGDAMVTDASGLVLGIKTADCVCVLLSTDDSKVIGAVHVGWRGAMSNLLYNTINLIKKLSNKEILATISPCIRRKSYEVGMDLYDKFLAFNADSKQFFHRNRDKKLFFNLPGFVKYQLKLLGIKRISDNHVTTYNSNKYFSVRFAKHQGFEEKRRNLSCITIKEENELLHRDLL